MVAGSILNEIIVLFQAHYSPKAYSASTRHECQKNVSGGKERPALKADYLTAI
jgi:hypothetical protein